MYEYLIAFFGLLVGGVIAYFTKEELKDGEKYFIWISRLLLLILGINFLVLGFNWWLALIGLVIGFFIHYEYLFLGLSGNVFSLSLVFIYGLFKGSLVWFKEKNRVYLINCLLFFIPMVLVILFGLDLVSLAGGGCFGVVVRKFWKKGLLN